MMVEQAAAVDRPRGGPPPRPSSKSKPFTNEILRQMESVAGEISDDQRAQILNILVGDTYTVMTHAEREDAEKIYTASKATAHGLQERCDEMEGSHREMKRRMEGMLIANADLAAQASDMKREAQASRHDEASARSRIHQLQTTEMSLQASLTMSEQNLQQTR